MRGVHGLLPFFLIPLLVAYNRHYRLRPLCRAWDLLPLLAVELVHLTFQVCAAMGNLQAVQYAAYLQYAFFLSLLFPIIRRGLYKAALWGAGCSVAGTLLNKIVMNANGGKMPVLPTLSELTGYCTREMLLSGADGVHIMMNVHVDGEGATKLNLLADYLDIGWCILSPGDILIHLFVSIIIYETVRSFDKPPQKIMSEGV